MGRGRGRDGEGLGGGGGWEGDGEGLGEELTSTHGMKDKEGLQTVALLRLLAEDL